MSARRPTLAVWKFASCDGCQLTLLDCEDELLRVAELIDIRYFLEATSSTAPGPYDLSLVEGSITTAADRERIHRIRADSRFLVTIGACATAGGIQALRNGRDIDAFVELVYARPEFIDTLATSTPISAHVTVDFELRGCPIDKRQLIEVLSAYLMGRTPDVRPHSVCLECKRRGTPCVLVTGDEPCLGPITHAGCGALCPSLARPCFGCFGPSELADTVSLGSEIRRRGHGDPTFQRLLSTFNVAAFTAEPEQAP